MFGSRARAMAGLCFLYSWRNFYLRGDDGLCPFACFGTGPVTVFAFSTPLQEVLTGSGGAILPPVGKCPDFEAVSFLVYQ